MMPACLTPSIIWIPTILASSLSSSESRRRSFSFSLPPPPRFSSLLSLHPADRCSCVEISLEQNCHDHKTFMTARTFNGEPEGLGGHALMLTCPPVNHLVHSPNTPYPHQLPDTSTSGLLKLMEISTNMPVQGGEITPALAWKVIRQDQRFHFLSQSDFANLTTELKMRCRCYG